MMDLLLLASDNDDNDNGNETVDKKDIADSAMEAAGEAENSVAFEACTCPAPHLAPLRLS